MPGNIIGNTEVSSTIAVAGAAIINGPVETVVSNFDNLGVSSKIGQYASVVLNNYEIYPQSIFAEGAQFQIPNNLAPGSTITRDTLATGRLLLPTGTVPPNSLPVKIGWWCFVVNYTAQSLSIASTQNINVAGNIVPNAALGPWGRGLFSWIGNSWVMYTYR